jgi:hypothetical protein
MAFTIFSQCSTITTGCFLYVNSILTFPASNGYYSNGTDCYTVTGGSGEVTAVGPCAVDVYFTLGGQTTFDSNGDFNYVLYASTTADSYSSNPINLNTTVSVQFNMVAEFSTYTAISGSIGSGFSCAYNTYIEGTYANQAVYSVTPTLVTPTSSGYQSYYESTGDLGSYLC